MMEEQQLSTLQRQGLADGRKAGGELAAATGGGGGGGGSFATMARGNRVAVSCFAVATAVAAAVALFRTKTTKD